MKFRTLLTSFLLILISSLSNASVSFSGTAIKLAYGDNPTSQVSVGSLGLVIVDVTGDGFLGSSLFGQLTASNDPEVATSHANLNVGSTFGGDLVIARLSAVGLNGNTNLTGYVNNGDMSSYLNRNFAIVWFSELTSSDTGSAPEGITYGIARGSNWITPSTNSGMYTFGGASGVFAQLTDGNPATTNMPGQSVSFATYGTTFKVASNSSSSQSGVPEPSSALLGAMGLLGLLRRRRA